MARLKIGREHAFEVVLKALDINCAKQRNRTELHSVGQQLDFLKALIEKAKPTLKHSHKGAGCNIDYTNAVLRTHICETVKGNGAALEGVEIKGEKRRIREFFQNGSDALPNEFLLSIDYTKPKKPQRKPRVKKGPSKHTEKTPPASKQDDPDVSHVTQSSARAATAPPTLAGARSKKGQKRILDEASTDNETVNKPAAKKVKEAPSSNTNDSDSRSTRETEVVAATVQQQSESVDELFSTPGQRLPCTLPIRCVTADEYAKLKDFAKLETELENWKWKYEELDHRYKRLEEECTSERNAMYSENEDLCAYMTNRNPSAHELDISRRDTTVDKVSATKLAWTEKEIDPDKRLREHGLPRLPDGYVRALREETADWAHLPSNDHDTSGLYRILEKYMRKTYSGVTEVATHYLTYSNAPTAGRARVVDCPDNELEKIYKTFFVSEDGISWRVEAQNLLESGMRYHEFLKGIIGAAFHDMVFMEGLPWSTAKEDFDKFRPIAKHCSKAMQDGGADITFDEMLQSGLYRRAVSPLFQAREVMPEAKTRAARLASILLPQLEELGVTGPSDPSGENFFYKKASASLTSSIMAALTVKSILEVIPVEYYFDWIAAGQTFNPDDMEMQGGGIQECEAGAAPIVARAVTPVLKYRDAGEPSDEGLTIPAMGVWLKKN